MDDILIHYGATDCTPFVWIVYGSPTPTAVLAGVSWEQVGRTISIAFELPDDWESALQTAKWNDTLMIKQQWRNVAELIQAAETDFDQAFGERLAAELQELNLPLVVLERIQQTATAALRRTFQGDSTRAACVMVLTRAVQAADQPIARSWGFFLVERAGGDGEPYQIMLFLYPDGS